MYNDCSSLERLKPLLESFCDMIVMIKLTCVATDGYSCHHTIWCAFLFTAFRYSSSRMWRITENLFTKVLDYLCLFWNRQNFLCCQELQHIHTVVDPGFPRGDFANLLFSFLLKTARKWKKLDWEKGHAFPATLWIRQYTFTDTTHTHPQFPTPPFSIGRPGELPKDQTFLHFMQIGENLHCNTNETLFVILLKQLWQTKVLKSNTTQRLSTS